MKAMLFSLVLFSLSSYAHVEPGNYSGRDQNGKDCSFIVGDMWFEDNMHHPLTERLPVSGITFAGVQMDNVIWNLGHPPVINTEVGTNRYNHGLFQQIIPTKVGAESVTLLKRDDKEDEEDGRPVGIIFVKDNYRSRDLSVVRTCLLD